MKRFLAALILLAGTAAAQPVVNGWGGYSLWGLSVPNPGSDVSSRALTVNAAGTALTWAAASGITPAGSGTEIQFRSGASAFGAVTGSSVSGGNLSLTGLLHIGPLAGGYANVSVLATRTTSDWHAFEDIATLNLGDTNLGYSSYDAAPIYNNSLSEQHLVSYQARPQLTGAGALGVVYGFWAFPNFGGAGTVGTYKGAYLQQPTGAGAVTNNIGIYVEPFTKGASTNWNIYSIGGAHYFSTTVEIGGALTVDGGVALPAQVVAIGSGALASNTTGTKMTALGTNSLTANVNGIENSAVGYGSEAANISGSSNTAFGTHALEANTTKSQSTAVGANALQVSNAVNNTGVGQGAMQNTTTGYSNTGIGQIALNDNVTGINNTGVGVRTGYNAGTPNIGTNECTYIGFGANASVDGLDNSTAIGNLSQVTASNQVVIGNSSVTNAYFGSVAPTATVHAAAYTVGSGNTAGMTTVVTVRNSGGSADCTISITGGLVTATTCSHT